MTLRDILDDYVMLFYRAVPPKSQNWTLIRALNESVVRELSSERSGLLHVIISRRRRRNMRSGNGRGQDKNRAVNEDLRPRLTDVRGLMRARVTFADSAGFLRSFRPGLYNGKITRLRDKKGEAENSEITGGVRRALILIVCRARVS